MAERAIFLDRDNTIIQDDGYLGDPAKVKLLPGAGTALTALRALGYRLIVVSNQSGVARGMFKEADVEAVNDEMSRQLRQQAGAYVDASYYCPFHPEAPLAEYRVDHDWRKPKAGMLLQAAADFGLDLTQCWMVGDSWRDIGAGAAARCRTILLRDPERKMPADELQMAKSLTPNFVVATLGDAARIIVREGRHGPAAAPPAPPPPDDPPPAAPHAESPAAAPVASPPPLPPVSPASPPAAPTAHSPPLDEAALAERVAEKVAQKMAAVAQPAIPDQGRAGNGGVQPHDAGTSAAPSPANANAPIRPARGVAPDLEKQLQDLVVQLRQQNRNAELRPDFSLVHITVLIVQTFAVSALALGLFKYFTMKVTFVPVQDMQFALMQALLWIAVAVFFELGVVALLIFGRNRS